MTSCTWLDEFLLNIIWTWGNVPYLFVEFDPGEVALGVSVLQPEEPDLAQANRLDDLVEQLLAGGRLLDGELQLGVHRRDAHI